MPALQDFFSALFDMLYIAVILDLRRAMGATPIARLQLAGASVAQRRAPPETTKHTLDSNSNSNSKSNVGEADFATSSDGVVRPTSSNGSKNNEAYV